jgi:cyclase
MTPSSNNLPTSPYFRLKRLAEGVWAAIVVRGMGAWGNAGIVALGNRALVFDTMLTPAAARDLRAAAESLTSCPVAYVANSHYHMDHIHGNGVFGDATILATTKTAERIVSRGAEILAHARQHPEVPASFDAQIARATSPDLRADLQVTQGEYRAFHAALPELTLHPPDITFEQQLTLHGTERSAQLLSYGGGHTSSDAFLLLPAERIAFLGDLLGIGIHPSFGQADLEAWDTILEHIEALAIETVVPGHGPIGTLAEVTALRRYLAEMETLVEEAIVRGETAEQVLALTPPDAYAAWDARDIFAGNVSHLYTLFARSAEEVS